MTKFDRIVKAITNKDPEILQGLIHPDFMLIRENGLVSKDEQLEFLQKMFDGDTEKALIDLHDRNPGEVFKARIRDNGNTFNIIDDSEDSSRIQLRGNGR